MNKLTLVNKRGPAVYSAASKKDRDYFEMLNRHITEGSMWCEPEHKRCEENERYAIGMQWQEGDAQRQMERERPAIPINKIRKVLDAVANREIMDRFVPKVYGRESMDDGVAELMDELSRWQRDLSETEHEESAAFRKNCMSGLGVMHKWWNDSALDGQGMIQDEEVPIWTMLWDPRARKQNMVDRRYHLSGKYVPLKEVQETYGLSKRIRNRMKSTLNMGGRASDSSAVSTSGSRWGWRDISSGDRWYLSAEQEVFVVEHEWLEKKRVWKAAVPTRMEEWGLFISSIDAQIQIAENPDTGEPEFLDIANFRAMSEEEQHGVAAGVLYESELQVIEDKKEILNLATLYEEYTGLELPYTEKKKDEVRYCINTMGDIILQEGVRPFGFTYEFLTGVPYEQRDGTRFRGMVDFGKGPQDMTNVFFSNMLAHYMSSGKGTLMIEEGLVDNPNEFLNNYAKLGGAMFVPDGMVQQWDARIRSVDGNAAPANLKELIQLMDSTVEDMFGLSSLEMGSQGDLRRVSGTVAGQARQATNTILAIWFDSLRRYRKRWGMLNLRFLQGVYTPQEMARIVGSEVAAGVAELPVWPDVNRFDIKIDESPTSVTEQMDMSNLLISSGTIEKLVDKGHLMPEDGIDFLYAFPKSQREKIKKGIRTMEKVQEQMQSMQRQVQEEQQRNALLMNFLLTVDRGGEIKQAFDTMFSMSTVMMQERDKMNQQQQQQGEAPQPTPMG